MAEGIINDRPAENFTEDQYGASLSVPVSIEPGATETVRLNLVWYVPTSNVSHYDSEVNEGYTPAKYEPWYSHRFADIQEVVAFWDNNYDSLKERSKLFSDTFLASTLPREVIDAVEKTLYINPRMKGDFRTFLSTNFGYASVGLKGGKPFVEVKEGNIPIGNIVVE